jgi:hypothetical protein
MLNLKLQVRARQRLRGNTRSDTVDFANYDVFDTAPTTLPLHDLTAFSEMLMGFPFNET